jgi:IS30 family transposase
MGSREALRVEEREVVSRELCRGRSARFIGTLLGRHHSAVSREIDRNGGRDGYRAVDAQARCEAMGLRPRARKLETSAELHDAVNDGLGAAMVPEADQRQTA